MKQAESSNVLQVPLTFNSFIVDDQLTPAIAIVATPEPAVPACPKLVKGSLSKEACRLPLPAHEFTRVRRDRTWSAHQLGVVLFMKLVRHQGDPSLHTCRPRASFRMTVLKKESARRN